MRDEEGEGLHCGEDGGADVAVLIIHIKRCKEVPLRAGLGHAAEAGEDAKDLDDAGGGVGGQAGGQDHIQNWGWCFIVGVIKNSRVRP